MSSFLLHFIINAFIFSFAALSHFRTSERSRGEREREKNYALKIFAILLPLLPFANKYQSQKWDKFLAYIHTVAVAFFRGVLARRRIVHATFQLPHISLCKHKNIEIDISQVNKFQMRCHTA